MKEKIKHKLKKEKILSLMCYINILVMIPLFISENKDVKFHIMEGLNLFIIENILYLIFLILDKILGWLFLYNVLKECIWGIIILLSIMGIINVIRGKNKKIPLYNELRIIK